MSKSDGQSPLRYVRTHLYIATFFSPWQPTSLTSSCVYTSLILRFSSFAYSTQQSYVGPWRMRLGGAVGMRLGGAVGMRLGGAVGMRLGGAVGMRLGGAMGNETGWGRGNETWWGHGNETGWDCGNGNGANKHSVGSHTRLLPRTLLEWLWSSFINFPLCFSQKLEDEVSNVAGNVFVAAACVAYCGAFTSSYRERVSLVRMLLNFTVSFPPFFSFSFSSIVSLTRHLPLFPSFPLFFLSFPLGLLCLSSTLSSPFSPPLLSHTSLSLFYSLLPLSSSTSGSSTAKN